MLQYGFDYLCCLKVFFSTVLLPKSDFTMWPGIEPGFIMTLHFLFYRTDICQKKKREMLTHVENVLIICYSK